jgi:hypothetical protein
MPNAVSAKSPLRMTYILFASYLIFHLLWRIMLPFGGWEVGLLHYWHVTADFVAAPLLVATRSGADRADVAASRAPVSPILFWTSLACGVGALLIRLSSDAAWWT